MEELNYRHLINKNVIKAKGSVMSYVMSYVNTSLL